MTAGRQALREELRELIHTWNPALPDDLGDDASLIESAAIDSLGLFNLVLWIESKSGRTIDPTSVDILRQWDTITAILDYLDPPTEHAPVTSKPAAPPRHMSRYRIVEYEPQFKRAVAEFQTRLWSPDPERTLRYLEWKYELNPCQGAGRIFLAFDADEIIGMRGFYASEWEFGRPARRIPLLVADDLLVSEAYRNKGLVNDLMSAARERLRELGERYVINLSGGPITVIESLAMGWRSAGTTGLLSRTLPPGILSTTVRRVLNRAGVAEPSPFARLDAAGATYDGALGLRVEIEDRPRVSGMADLIARVGHDARLRHVRDEPYLEWRYKNPLHEYRFLYAVEGAGALRGFLALKRSSDRDPPPRRVTIVDLEAMDEGVKSALLRTAVGAGAFAEMTAWASTVSDQTLAELRRLAFMSTDASVTSGSPQILVWSLDQGADDQPWLADGIDLLDLSNWDMRVIYSMVG